MHHCAAIYRKLGVKTRPEATAVALRTGLVDPADPTYPGRMTGVRAHTGQAAHPVITPMRSPTATCSTRRSGWVVGVEASNARCS